MHGYACIGSLYMLREREYSDRLLWAVVSNNRIDKTTTLMVVEDCEEKGKTITIAAKSLWDKKPVGPILPPKREIVTENGIEFIKPFVKEEEEEKSATMRF